MFLYDNKQYRAIHFNYNGFRITKIDSSLELFKKGGLYHFIIVQDTIHINARCIEVNGEFAVFSFEKISPEAGVELAKYYSKRLHATKLVIMCNNT